MLETVRTWWEHEKDAMGKTLESFRSVPADRRDDPGFQRALDKYAHILAARAVWLSRVGDGERPDELFPTGVSIGDIGAMLTSVTSGWDRYLNDLDDGALGTSVEYESTDGSAWSNTLLEIFTHAYTHGFYHRGQVATLIADLGGSPVDTDFILFARQHQTAP